MNQLMHFIVLISLCSLNTLPINGAKLPSCKQLKYHMKAQQDFMGHRASRKNSLTIQIENAIKTLKSFISQLSFDPNNPVEFHEECAQRITHSLALVDNFLQRKELPIQWRPELFTLKRTLLASNRTLECIRARPHQPDPDSNIFKPLVLS